MKLQTRPKQARINSFRMNDDHWARFQALAEAKGWQALGAMRQLVIQYAAKPFGLSGDRQPTGEARTGWFDCDAHAVAALKASADEAGISLNDALRELVARAVRH